MAELSLSPRLHFKQSFISTGIATHEPEFNVMRESSVRTVVENANTNNVLRCEAKIKGQTDWTPIGTIGANGEIVLNTSRFDLLRFVVEVYHPLAADDYPIIITSGFTY